MELSVLFEHLYRSRSFHCSFRKLLIYYFLLNTVSASPQMEQYPHDGILNGILVDQTGNVLVGGKDVIFQFSNMSITPDKLVNRVDTSCISANCSEHFRTENCPSVFQFITIASVRYLLFCGSRLNRPCYLYNYTDITQSWKVQVPNTYIPGYTGEAYFGSHSSSVLVQQGDSRRRFEFFVAIPVTGSSAEDIDSYYTLSHRVLKAPTITEPYAGTYYITRKRSISNDSFIKSQPDYRLEFVYGFNTTDHGYFLRNTIDQDNIKTAFISQVCLGDIYFRSYIEAKLACSHWTELVAASALNTPRGMVLVASFTGDKGQRSGALCAYNVTNIDEFFKKKQEDCFKAVAGSSPGWIYGAPEACSTNILNDWHDIKCGYTDKNPRILASGSVKEDKLLQGSSSIFTSIELANDDAPGIDVYLGTEKGSVGKALYSIDFGQSIVTWNITGQPPGLNIRDLTLNKEKDKLFYIQGKTVNSVILDCKLYQDCQACLQWKCVWLLNEEQHKCVAATAVDRDDKQIFQKVCPPVVSKISPERGPIGGGTRLTLEGTFTPPSDFNSVYVTDSNGIAIWIGDVKCLHVQTLSSDKLICQTPEVNATVDSRVHVQIDTPPNRSDSRYSEIPLSGVSLENHTVFQYLKPDVRTEPPLIVRLSGQTQIQIIGTHLDIGGVRAVTIGKKACVVTDKDMYNDTMITCRTPNHIKTRKYNLTLQIDSEVIEGPEVTYIQDPALNDSIPVIAHTISSGGVKITLHGQRLEGLGTGLSLVFPASDGFPQLSDNGPCEISSNSNKSYLVCKTDRTLASPGTVLDMVVQNVYGILLRPTCNITVHRDPEIDKQEHVVYKTAFTSRKAEQYSIKGKYLKPFLKGNIEVNVGSHMCHIKSVTETEIACNIEWIPNGVTYDIIVPVTITIGARDYGNIGTVIFHREQTTVQEQESSTASDTQLSIIVGIVIACIAVIVVAVVVLKCYRSNRQKDEPYNVQYHHDNNILTLDGLSESHATDPVQTRQNTYQQRGFAMNNQDNTSVKETEPLLPLLDEVTLAILEEKGLLIPRDCLVLGEVVGQGHFGCVFRAYLRREGVKGEENVAAKTMHRNSPIDLDVHMFIKEALIMKDFQHRNVMQLIGLCFGIEKLPLVVLPFMKKGDVLSYIRDVNNVPTVRDLVLFSVDIANGMDYLSQLKFVHRDLAARNCMINEDMTVKVADFGLSRDVYEKEYYSSCDKKTKLPVKWMSPESLEFGHFSHKTDVWSFGVVLWELLTRGMNPYPTVDNWDIMRYLKDDRRLNKPDFCPDEMYNIMLRCWCWEADDRPTFGELAKQIPELLRKLERLSERRKRLESRHSEQNEGTV